MSAFRKSISNICRFSTKYDKGPMLPAVTELKLEIVLQYSISVAIRGLVNLSLA